MGAYSQQATLKRKPSRTVKLQPHHFADKYHGKPDGPVDVGIKILGERDLEEAASYAEGHANLCHPKQRHDSDLWIEAFNRGLRQFAVARGTTKPNDVSEPYFEYADDVVPLALSPEGIHRLYLEIDLLCMMEDVKAPAIGADEQQRLAEMLRTGAAWEGLSEADQRRLSHLLFFALRIAEAKSLDFDIDD